MNEIVHRAGLQFAVSTMIDKQMIAILRVGPESSHGPRAPETHVPFVIEVQTQNGPATLQFGPQAAAALAEDLASYMKMHSKPAIS